MKDFLTKVLTITLFLSSLAFHQKPKSMTMHDLVGSFSQAYADQIPEKIAKTQITKLFVSKKILQFKLQGHTIQIRWIGERTRLMMLNGRIFSLDEIRSEDRFKQAFSAKFGLRIPAALDSTSIDLDNLDDLFGEELDQPKEEKKEREDVCVETKSKKCDGDDDDDEEGGLTKFLSRQDFLDADGVLGGTKLADEIVNMTKFLGKDFPLAQKGIQSAMLSIAAAQGMPGAEGVKFLNSDVSEFDPGKIKRPSYMTK